MQDLVQFASPSAVQILVRRLAPGVAERAEGQNVVKACRNIQGATAHGTDREAEWRQATRTSLVPRALDLAEMGLEAQSDTVSPPAGPGNPVPAVGTLAAQESPLSSEAWNI